MAVLDGMVKYDSGDYDAAQMAFSKATQLFEQARDRSWEERIRGASLSESRN